MRNIKIFLLLCLPFAVSCNSKPAAETPVTIELANAKQEKIIGERIDGPANVRSEPGGEILFTLDDNVLVEIGRPKNDWHEIMVYADIDSNEVNMDSIRAGREIMIGGKRAGKVMKTHWVGTSSGKEVYAMLYGYIHKSNIKPETVIEGQLEKEFGKLAQKRDLSAWQEFIFRFDLQPENDQFPPFHAYYTYEDAVDDPSPGFRILLLFEDNELKGLVHSRPLNLSGMDTYDAGRGYHVSFYQDYPMSKQRKFVGDLEQWIMSVD